MEQEEIAISLPIEIWEKIAGACIQVADWDNYNNDIKDTLRRTYFEIKANIR